MVYNITMIKLNIHEAKTHLSRYLDQLKEKGVIILCKRNIPVAEIRPIPPPDSAPRPAGLEKGKFTVDSEFFDQLPEVTIERFANPQ